MRNWFLWISLFFLWPFEGIADPTTDAIAAVTQDVREVCTQPATQGAHWQISGDASADGGINLKLLKIASVSANLHFAKAEWKGVKQVLDSDQANDNANYRKCVEELTPKFLDKLKKITPVAVTNCHNAGNCAGINVGSQNVYYGGAVLPPPRVISSEDAAAAVLELQTAHSPSTIVLLYAGKRETEEIRAFYTQVTNLFLLADHWRIVSVENVGPSMVYASGATLTGEGIGCSADKQSGEASAIAKRAMARSSYPCTREAVPWRFHINEKSDAQEEPVDIVISIGTRIIPPS